MYKLPIPVCLLFLLVTKLMYASDECIQLIVQEKLDSIIIEEYIFTVPLCQLSTIKIDNGSNKYTLFEILAEKESDKNLFNINFFMQQFRLNYQNKESLMRSIKTNLVIDNGQEFLLAEEIRQKASIYIVTLLIASADCAMELLFFEDK